jgi:hypothetical protein
LSDFIEEHLGRRSIEKAGTLENCHPFDRREA